MADAGNDAKTTSPLTQSQQLRIELLKLCYRHDRTPQDVTVRASELERYVNGDAEKPAGNDGQADDAGPI